MPPEEKRQTLSQQQDELLLLAETLGEVKDRLARIEGEYTAQTAPLDAAKATQDSALVALNAALEGIKQLNFHVLENNLGEVSKRIEAVSRSAEEAIGQLHNKLDNEALLRGEAIVALDQKLSRAESTRAEFTKQQTEQHQNFGKVFAEIRQTIDQTREELAANLQKAVTQFAEPAGLNPRGKWDAQATYARLDLVSLNGSSYVSMVDGNRDKPSRNSKTWGLIASRGGSALGGGATDITGVAGIGATGLLLVQSGTASDAREILGVNDFTGATSSEDGTAGRVIKPSAGDQTKYLRGDGTWTTPSTVTAPAASQSEVNAGTEDAKYVSPLTNEVRTLAGDTPRQVANMLLFDGTTGANATAELPWSVAGQDLWFLTVVDWPSSISADRCLLAFGPEDGFSLFLDNSDDKLYFRRYDSALTDYRSAIYENTLTDYGGTRVPVFIRLLADGTHELWLNGVKLAEDATDTGGTPPAWIDDVDATTLLTGYDTNATFSGQIRPVKMGLGTWTDAEILKWAQTGIEPDWVTLTGDPSADELNGLDWRNGSSAPDTLTWSGMSITSCVDDGSGTAQAVSDGTFNLIYGQRYAVIIPSATLNSGSWPQLKTGSDIVLTSAGGLDLTSYAGQRIVYFTATSTGALRIGWRITAACDFSHGAMQVIPAGHLIIPAINPGDLVGTDLGANTIPTLIDDAQVVGNTREHDEPITLTVSHSGAGNLQFGGQNILPTLRANAIESIIVTSAAAVTWSLGSSDGGEQYVSDLSLSAAEQYVAPSDIVTYLLTGGALWSKVDGACTITISIKTRSR